MSNEHDVSFYNIKISRNGLQLKNIRDSLEEILDNILNPYKFNKKRKEQLVISVNELVQNTIRAKNEQEKKRFPAVRAPYNIEIIIYKHQYVPDNNVIREEDFEGVPYCEINISNYVIGENNFFKPQKIPLPAIAGNKKGCKKGGMGVYMAGLLCDSLTYIIKEFEIRHETSTEETGLDKKTIKSIKEYMSNQKLGSLKIQYIEASVRIAIVDEAPAKKNPNNINITVIEEINDTTKNPKDSYHLTT